MCCHCYEPFFRLKDLTPFIPLIGTIFIASLSYIGITTQINKNRKAKWIEDFRKEVAFITHVVIHRDKSIEREKTFKEFLNSTALIRLYLDLESNNLHQKFFDQLSKFVENYIKNDSEIDNEEFSLEFQLIIAIAQRIIKVEEDKINRIF